MTNIRYISNQGKLYFFNISTWKMIQIEPFFDAPDNQKFICKDFEDAISKGLDKNSKIFIYGIKCFPKLQEFSKKYNITIYRIEDGFIYSLLFSSIFMPYSLVVDSRGVYFDPRIDSDLEYIIQNYNFDDKLLERAKLIREYIVASKLSKYNHLKHISFNIDRSKYNKVILVTGQVEDTISMKYGAFGLNNIDLLKLVRRTNPNSYIIYKPHPNVISENIPKTITDKFANKVVTNISIDSVIIACDEVHTLTSSVGFDALLREKKVYTYGMPFYASWGLTHDYRKSKRRTRKITLDELVASVLILYPRYISPKTNKLCEIEQTLKELKEEQELYFNNRWHRLKTNLKGWILLLRYNIKALRIQFHNILKR